MSSMDSKSENIQTPAEREREKSLLDDPYARVLGPASVQCKQCLKKIKLSSKSAYDTFHWRNHRARCLRAMKKRMKTAEVTMKQSVQSPPLPRTTVTRKPIRRTKRPKTPTPPLVSDSEDDRRSGESVKARSPTAPTSPLECSSPQVRTYVAYADPSLEEYMLRSHPECVQSSPLVTSRDHGRNWSWSQLKQPHFANPIQYDDDDDGDEDEGRLVSYPCDRSVVDADEREQEAARTLSTLFRSR